MGPCPGVPEQDAAAYPSAMANRDVLGADLVMFTSEARQVATSERRRNQKNVELRRSSCGGSVAAP
jgi:hypothetical protein